MATSSVLSCGRELFPSCFGEERLVRTSSFKNRGPLLFSSFSQAKNHPSKETGLEHNPKTTAICSPSRKSNVFLPCAPPLYSREAVSGVMEMEECIHTSRSVTNPDTSESAGTSHPVCVPTGTPFPFSSSSAFHPFHPVVYRDPEKDIQDPFFDSAPHPHVGSGRFSPSFSPMSASSSLPIKKVPIPAPVSRSGEREGKRNTHKNDLHHGSHNEDGRGPDSQDTKAASGCLASGRVEKRVAPLSPRERYDGVLARRKAEKRGSHDTLPSFLTSSPTRDSTAISRDKRRTPPHPHEGRRPHAQHSNVPHSHRTVMVKKVRNRRKTSFSSPSQWMDLLHYEDVARLQREEGFWYDTVNDLHEAYDNMGYQIHHEDEWEGWNREEEDVTETRTQRIRNVLQQEVKWGQGGEALCVPIWNGIPQPPFFPRPFSSPFTEDSIISMGIDEEECEEESSETIEEEVYEEGVEEEASYSSFSCSSWEEEEEEVAERQAEHVKRRDLGDVNTLSRPPSLFEREETEEGEDDEEEYVPPCPPIIIFPETLVPPFQEEAKKKTEAHAGKENSNEKEEAWDDVSLDAKMRRWRPQVEEKKSIRPLDHRRGAERVKIEGATPRSRCEWYKRSEEEVPPMWSSVRTSTEAMTSAEKETYLGSGGVGVKCSGEVGPDFTRHGHPRRVVSPDETCFPSSLAPLSVMPSSFCRDGFTGPVMAPGKRDGGSERAGSTGGSSSRAVDIAPLPTSVMFLTSSGAVNDTSPENPGCGLPSSSSSSSWNAWTKTTEEEESGFKMTHSPSSPEGRREYIIRSCPFLLHELTHGTTSVAQCVEETQPSPSRTLSSDMVSTSTCSVVPPHPERGGKLGDRSLFDIQKRNGNAMAVTREGSEHETTQVAQAVAKTCIDDDTPLSSIPAGQAREERVRGERCLPTSVSPGGCTVSLSSSERDGTEPPGLSMSTWNSHQSRSAHTVSQRKEEEESGTLNATTMAMVRSPSSFPMGNEGEEKRKTSASLTCQVAYPPTSFSSSSSLASSYPPTFPVLAIHRVSSSSSSSSSRVSFSPSPSPVPPDEEQRREWEPPSATVGSSLSSRWTSSACVDLSTPVEKAKTRRLLFYAADPLVLPYGVTGMEKSAPCVEPQATKDPPHVRRREQEEALVLLYQEDVPHPSIRSIALPTSTRSLSSERGRGAWEHGEEETSLEGDGASYPAWKEKTHEYRFRDHEESLFMVSASTSSNGSSSALPVSLTSSTPFHASLAKPVIPFHSAWSVTISTLSERSPSPPTSWLSSGRVAYDACLDDRSSRMGSAQKGGAPLLEISPRRGPAWTPQGSYDRPVTSYPVDAPSLPPLCSTWDGVMNRREEREKKHRDEWEVGEREEENSF